MNVRIRRRAAGSLLVVALAGCSAGGAPAASSPGTTATSDPGAATAPAASASVGEPFAIRTPAQEPQACMDALMSGTIVRHIGSGLGVRAVDGQQMAVEWPFGYTAREVGGRVSLLDETGKVVAREGDEISVGGGFGTQLWHACGRVTVTKAVG